MGVAHREEKEESSFPCIIICGWETTNEANMVRSLACQTPTWEHLGKNRKPFTKPAVVKECLLPAADTLLDGKEKQELQGNDRFLIYNCQRGWKKAHSHSWIALL